MAAAGHRYISLDRVLVAYAKSIGKEPEDLDEQQRMLAVYDAMLAEPKPGRPALEAGQRAVIVSVTMTRADKELLEEIGHGNRSQGARTLLENWRYEHQTD